MLEAQVSKGTGGDLKACICVAATRSLNFEHLPGTASKGCSKVPEDINFFYTQGRIVAKGVINASWLMRLRS